jgi:uncharacterized protein (DUF983 family)
MSKLTGILKMKCPRCRQGNLFSNSNPYILKDGLKMPEKCNVCGQDFKIEPGFYIGALWTSFPIVIFLLAILSVYLLVYLKMEMNLFFVVISVVLFGLQPIIVRLGRVIWISIFVDYDPFIK